MALIVAMGLQFGAASATHLGVPHLNDAQTFNVNVDVCFGGTGTGMIGTESATLFNVAGALPNCVGQALGTSAPTTVSTSVLLPAGNRLALPLAYNDVAFVHTPPADGTIIGTVKSAVDVGCNGTVDIFADSSNIAPVNFTTQDVGFTNAPLVGEQYVERTTTFTATSGIDGASETFLDARIPPYAKVARYRADIDTLFINGGTTPLALANKTSLNNIIQTLPFGPGARVSSTILGGDNVAPGTQLVLCLDSPQTSLSQYDVIAGYSNPAADGVYPVWVVEMSAAGTWEKSNQTLVYTTSCKQIGAGAGDADNDCLADSAETGACPSSATADSDGDGLLDGIEVSWGSNPCATDTDVLTDAPGDGRTDAEEMAGPSEYLTDPTKKDTDGDLLLDSGLSLDCNGDGLPDVAPVRQNGGANTGRNRVTMQIVACGAVLGLGGASQSGPDNCPNKSNAAQTNHSTLDKPNGLIVGSVDNSQENGRWLGDACSGDRDNDGIPDKVEDGSTGLGFFFANLGLSAPDGGADNKCNTKGLAAAKPALGTQVAISLGDVDGDGLAAIDDPDSDNDGTIDGIECQMGSNPSSLASLTAGITGDMIQFFRLTNLVLAGGAIDLDADQDGFNGESDADGACVQTGAADANGQLKCIGPLVSGGFIGDGLQTRGDIGRMGADAATNLDNDSDGCADIVEVLDMNGDQTADIADQLQMNRAYAKQTTPTQSISGWATPPTQLELSIMDTNGDGALDPGDQLPMNRFIAGKYGPINPACDSSSIGNGGAN
jgi:hypothetical protein